jgi:hypothetical protein
MKQGFSISVLARPVLAAATAAIGMLTPATLAAQAPNQLYAQLSEQLTIDAKCKVLNPDQRLAMELFADEIRALVTPADQTTVGGWLEGVKTNLASVPCNDPRLVGPIKAIQDAATIHQEVWASRIIAIWNLRNSTNWASMSQISGLKGPVASKVMATLAARNPEAAKQLKARADAEAGRALSILCPTVSIARANCPALAAPLNPGEAEFATVWLQRVEKYAAQLPGARLDGKPVLPVGVGDWNQLYATVPLDQAFAMAPFEMACEASNKVVRADGPLPRNSVEIAPATIFNASDGFEIGRGEITEYGRVLKLGGAWIERLGMQSMGLVRCRSQP